MGIKIKYSESSLAKGLDNMSEKLGAVLLMFAQNKAIQLQAEMKAQRPWKDRTGQAKASLSAVVSSPNESTVRITLAHGVDYGIWLELAHGKNYAIIVPTIDRAGPQMISELHGLLGKLNIS